MEAIQSPFFSLPIPSPLATLSQSPQIRRIHVHFTTNERHHPLTPLSDQFRTRALNRALVIAADISASPRGDISVLIPVSAVLLFMYWLSNFVVADMVIKDLQKKASEVEEKPEQQQASTSESRYDGASATGEPPNQPTRRKLKKSDLMKMMKQK